MAGPIPPGGNSKARQQTKVSVKHGDDMQEKRLPRFRHRPPATLTLLRSRKVAGLPIAPPPCTRETRTVLVSFAEHGREFSRVCAQRKYPGVRYLKLTNTG